MKMDMKPTKMVLIAIFIVLGAVYALVPPSYLTAWGIAFGLGQMYLIIIGVILWVIAALVYWKMK